MTYTNWKSYSQPDNPDDHCMALRSDLGYFWADENCNSTYNFVCIMGTIFESPEGFAS